MMKDTKDGQNCNELRKNKNNMPKTLFLMD